MQAGSDNDSLAKAARLRTRAEEIRSAAEGMHSAPARTTMLHIADTYERLANHLDEHPNPVKDAG
jgi:hypothetical protein